MELQRLGSRCGSGFVLILLAAGCGGGSGSASGLRVSPPVGEVKNVTVTPEGDDAFIVDYRVTDILETVELRFEFSQDLGGTFTASEATSGERELEVGETTGRLTWRAVEDLGMSGQGDLVLRITPYGKASGRPGLAAVSAPFEYRENSAPQLLACQAVASPSGGIVTIRLSARDAEGDVVTFSGAYSTNRGRTVSPAAFTEATGTSIALAPEPRTVDVMWDAASALDEGIFSQVTFTIVLRNESQSASAVTPSFTLNTYRPTITGITIEDIPDYMNGSTTFTNLDNAEQSFRLLVPRRGFTLHVGYAAHEDGASLDTSSLSVAASVPLGPAGEIAAEEDLGALFLCGGADALLVVTESMSLPPGPVTLTATVADTLGNRSLPLSYEFDVESANQAVRPFASADTWRIDFSRDYWTLQSQVSGQRVTVTTQFTPNGQADFIDDLALLGLYSAEAPDLSAQVVELVKDRTLANLREFYEIDQDGTPGADSPAITFTLAANQGTSVIAVGGADPGGGYTLGRAYFDRGNTGREQNTSAVLGVFTTSLIRFYINVSYSFKDAFDPFIPSRGDPIGTVPEDAVILDDAFVPGAEGNTDAAEERYQDLYAAAEAFGRAAAAILAHEIGHGVGLVANGPPPQGLFGGESNASFSGYWTDPYHFDAPGNNVMESSMSFTTMQYRGSQALRFDPLDRAYLLERILLTR
jgi:hypothetical protein